MSTHAVLCTHSKKTTKGNEMKVSIAGYQEEAVCQHCGRNLRHGVCLSDGRIVGATCLDKKLSKPKSYFGKSYRLGAEKIIVAAKVAQFKAPHQWAQYGVNKQTLEFDLV